MKKSSQVNFISVVVPVYNEEGCLQELIDRTLKALTSTGKKFESFWSMTGVGIDLPEIMKTAADAHPDVVIALHSQPQLRAAFGDHGRVLPWCAATWSSPSMRICRIRRRRFRDWLPRRRRENDVVGHCPAESSGYAVPPDRFEDRECRRSESHRCTHEGLRLYAPRLPPSCSGGDAAVQ